MDTQPHSLTAAEWAEIGSIEAVRQSWGIQPGEDFAAIVYSIYAVKFHFHSGGPGYVGDLYILQGDALIGEPMTLIRDNDGKLFVH